MASPRRRSPRDLTAEIGADGPRFRFFQAVRLLGLTDGRSEAVPPRLRFGTPLSLAFPASEILEVTERRPAAEDGEPALPAECRMTVGFMGLTGPSGALPTAYTELLLERRHRYRDTAAHRFLDLFSHRAVTLFYQAWRKYRFYLHYETGNREGFSRNLLDLVGVGLTHLQERLGEAGKGIPDRFLIHYAGLLSQKPLSATGIAALVRGYFGADARLEQFVGHWIEVPAGEQTRLGRQANRLGEDAFLGERLWDRQTKVRLRLGPLSAEAYAEFLPGRPGVAALKELLHFCVGHSLACDAALELRRADIPEPILDGRAPLALGYNLWLNSRPAEENAADAQFRLLADAA